MPIRFVPEQPGGIKERQLFEITCDVCGRQLFYLTEFYPVDGMRVSIEDTLNLFRKNSIMCTKCREDKKIKLELDEKVVDWLRNIGKFVGNKTPFQVIIDALRVYNWVLKIQSRGESILGDKEELIELIVDKEQARRYYEEVTRGNNQEEI